MTITLTEAGRTLGRLIDQVRITGEPITITEYGRPVAKLVPEPAADPE